MYRSSLEVFNISMTMKPRKNGQRFKEGKQNKSSGGKGRGGEKPNIMNGGE